MTIQDFGHRRLHRTRKRYLAVEIPARISVEWQDVYVVNMIRTVKDGADIITIAAIHGDPEQPHEPTTRKPTRLTFAQKKQAKRNT